MPEKKYSALEVLGKISGLGEDEAKRIFDEVQANQKLLDECEGPHEFVPAESQGKLVRKYRCELCGGVLDSINVKWYKRGFEHGKEDTLSRL